MIRILCSFLFMFLAGAAQDNGGDWMRFSLKEEGFFNEMYKNSIADSIFLPAKRNGFLPPVQYISRPSTGTLEADVDKIKREILRNLGVELNSRSTILLRGGRIKAGPGERLPGYLLEYQSNDHEDTYVTCLAVVKQDQVLHTIYVQAFQTSLPNCTKRLLELARHPALLK